MKAYRLLRPLHGKGIPRLLASGTLTSASTKADPQPRYITPNILLLEFIPNTLSVKDADPDLLQPDLIRSLIDTATSSQSFGVVHQDPNPGNYLFSPTRAVIIDFGKALFREEGESDEDWEEVVWSGGDPLRLRVCLAQKLGVKFLDDYLEKAT